jgi:DNA repair exonuclease SbcCD ATPase subunit
MINSKMLQKRSNTNGVKSYSKRIQALTATLDHAERQLLDERLALEVAQQQVTVALTAQRMLQELAQGVQEQAHACIAEIVSKCLETVFEEPYQFKIEFERKRGKTDARLVFLRDEHEIDPLEGSGGGVIDVASFALRLACLVLSRPPARKIMILDEPMKFVSEDYRPRVRFLLETLAEEMGVQFVIVSHDKAFQIGTVVELS